ncbi:lantibiotic streptin [Streptococcus agalactiae]|nr:lantibiotic streptin [Streptococcus agalactiae]QHO93578.1 lantibiotic streptin [Streptococcus agalactiae]
MKNTIKDFDLDLKTTKNNFAQPLVGSRYLCTPGSCWKLVCFTTTVK